MVEVSNSDSSKIEKYGDSAVFANQMKCSLNTKEYSDVKFIVGEQRRTIHAHRVILASRCDVFKAMFSDSTSQDTPLVLNDVNADSFYSILEFLYSNFISLTTNNAIDILGTSMEYGLDDLRKVCCDFLKESLTPSFVGEAIHAGVYFEQKDLEIACLQYIENNTLNKLRQDALIVSENVMKEVRIGLFTTDELNKFQESYHTIVPEYMFSFAWKFHALKSVTDKDKLVWITPRKGTHHRPHYSDGMKFVGKYSKKS